MSNERVEPAVAKAPECEHRLFTGGCGKDGPCFWPHCRPKTTTPAAAGPRIEFDDQWDNTHSLSLSEARDELRDYYNAWPGGAHEIRSTFATKKTGETP